MRRRLLDPDFFTDEKVVQVSDSAKLLFTGLWCMADREGLVDDKPIVIGLKVRPWDAPGVPRLIEELVAIGLVIRRVDDIGQACLGLPGFKKHQKPHVREVPSKFKFPLHAPKKGTEAIARSGEPRRSVSVVDPVPVLLIPESVPDAVRDPKSSLRAAPVAEPKRVTRMPSVAEMVLMRFEELRIARCVELGLSLDPEPLPPAFVNTAFARIVAYCGYEADPSVGIDDACDRVSPLWRLYLTEETWRSKTPPWPFRLFATAGVYQSLRARELAIEAGNEVDPRLPPDEEKIC